MFGLFLFTFDHQYEQSLLICVADCITELDNYFDDKLKDFPLIDTLQTHIVYCENFKPHYYYKPIKYLS